MTSFHFFTAPFLLLLLTHFFTPSSSQQQPNTDFFYVSNFLHKMSPPSFSLSVNVCSWKGVFCDGQQQHVIALLLSGMNLSGPIPDATIGKLTDLRALDLSNNGVTGLPTDLWGLSSLRVLNLSHNQISGSLSSNVGNFGLLETLDLSFNNFSGEIPAAIGSLMRLQALKLDGNLFESSIPSSILNCHLLVSLRISSNKLNGKLPSGFGEAFPNLKYLNLAENGIHGRVIDFRGLVVLSELNVSANLFRGSVMGVFEGFLPLEVIDLSRNQFGGHLPQVVESGSRFDWLRLRYLDLSENQLSGEIFPNLNQFPNLKHLNLASNRFSRKEFPQIDLLSGLEYLNLSETGLIGHIPVFISKLSSLSRVDLSGNHLNGRIPALNDEKFRVFDVSRNNLSGDIPVNILDRLPQMEKFNFSYNNLSLCASGIDPHILQTAFIGLEDGCPIAADPVLFQRRSAKHKELVKLVALAFTLLVFCLLVGLFLLLASGYRKKKTRMWAVNHKNSYKEEQNVSGPFSFEADSTTWVADVKQATVVPVVIFEKPLLNFSFADLLSATSHFDRGTLLAEGRFGPVYRGFLAGGIHAAVKVLVHGSTMTDQEAARELEHLGRIKHPNLVPLIGYCLAGEQRIAIYEYMENGNLQNLLHDLPLGVQRTEDWSMDTWEEDPSNGIHNIGSEGLLTTWRFRHKVALGTARALAFLHHGCSPPIVHRDVKASSVYLDSELEPRLSDFGLAKIFGEGIGYEITRGSPGYVPPEFSQPETGTPTLKSDVYGFGVVVFELITGKRPAGDHYPEEEEATLVSWVRGLVRKNQGFRAIDPKIRVTGSDEQMLEALKVGYLCTADVPSKRPTMQQIVGLLKDIELS
ncbi:hypothetical protein Ancab_006714 [Ancistrocladus abbreviatus]